MSPPILRRSMMVPFQLLLLALAGCAGTPLRPTPTSPTGEALFNGRTHEDVTCYKCHNGDGLGTMRGPSLAKRVPALSDEQIAHAIEDGPGPMPAYKDKVSAAEIQQITAWLRDRFPRATP